MSRPAGDDLQRYLTTPHTGVTGESLADVNGHFRVTAAVSLAYDLPRDFDLPVRPLMTFSAT